MMHGDFFIYVVHFCKGAGGNDVLWDGFDFYHFGKDDGCGGDICCCDDDIDAVFAKFSFQLDFLFFEFFEGGSAGFLRSFVFFAANEEVDHQYRRARHDEGEHD